MTIDTKTHALWSAIRRALLMVVAAIEKYLETPADGGGNAGASGG